MNSRVIVFGLLWRKKLNLEAVFVVFPPVFVTNFLTFVTFFPVIVDFLSKKVTFTLD